MKNAFAPIWNRPQEPQAGIAYEYINLPTGRLWAILIAESSIFPCTKNRFQRDLQAYNQENGCRISTTQLLECGWIRHINNEIVLAEVTRSSVSLEDVQARVSEQLNEHDQLSLQFLSWWKAKQRTGLYIVPLRLKARLKPFQAFGITPEWLKEHNIITEEDGYKEYRVTPWRNESLSLVQDEVFAILLNTYAGGVDSIDKLRDFLRRIVRTRAFWLHGRNPFLSHGRLKTLVDLSRELLMSEPDLLNSDIEVVKTYFDCEGWKHHNLYDQPPHYQFTANEHYALVKQVKLFEWHYHDLFSGQNARNQYSFLLRLIVA